MDIYDASNNDYIYGFCTLGQASGLNDIWFGLPAGTTPPAAVYIVITDRKCGQTYTSDPISIPICPCPYPDIPDPVISSVLLPDGTYNLPVQNYADFPDCIFASTDAYGSCGLNLTPSRSWVDIYNAVDDTRLFGFCAFKQASDLTLIWVSAGAQPMSVYITITDRKCGQVYKSNTVSLIPQ